jgi:hypothetical protein
VPLLCDGATKIMLSLSLSIFKKLLETNSLIEILFTGRQSNVYMQNDFASLNRKTKYIW